MTLTIHATYENGVLKPKEPLALDEGAEVELIVMTPLLDDDDPLDAVIGICEGPPDGAANHDQYLYGDRHS
jgi:predicted DNA-binding antitoxin AbrB/MazE fold protein